MSEETNDGTWSGLKKTIIGTLSTVVAGGGTWLGVTLFGGGHEESKEETKTEQVQQAAPVVVNVQQTQDNKQKVENGGPTVIRERVVEKPTQPAQPQPKPQEESW
jgi:alpha-L-fucosidase